METEGADVEVTAPVDDFGVVFVDSGAFWVFNTSIKINFRVLGTSEDGRGDDEVTASVEVEVDVF